MLAAEKIEPDRSFKMALRSTRLLGVISTGVGLVMLVGYGFYNRLIQFRMAFELLATLVWLLPGVAFLLAAIMMKDRRRWAVFVAMGAAAVQLIPAIGLFIAMFIYGPISLVPVIWSVLWIAALIVLLGYLKQSLASLRLVDADKIHGFELIQRQPIAAIPIDDTAVQSSESERGK